MLADGADITEIERTMSEALVRGLSWAMSAHGMDKVDVESGGFPTVPLRMSRGYSPILPVVAYKAETNINVVWLKNQSREWGARRLAECVGRIAEAIVIAARRDGASGVVGLDRSSLRTMFEPNSERNGYKIRFFSSLVYERNYVEEGGVVETTQTEVNVGTFDLGKLPEEIDEIMVKVRSSANEIANDPGIDAILEAMMNNDSFSDVME